MTLSTTLHIGGDHQRTVTLTDDQVFLATRGHRPEALRTYGVSVDGVLWPPIQLVRLATGIPGNIGEKTNYVSHGALRALRELGFATFEPVEYTDSGDVVVRDSRKRGRPSNDGVNYVPVD